LKSFANDIRTLAIASFLFAAPLVALGTFAAFNAQSTQASTGQEATPTALVNLHDHAGIDPDKLGPAF
tara:strand:- start:53 stop:256 length:204 start_codon:yes stop_codon:yes gene_type:complete